ncbi:hypothetical protein [Aquabacterium humicola]|uniref:hypothetical protein n=1 Tax=Aquabacterium humicola TaxID=3237377 RepID=UPI00254381BC|nr:hypothetical protein [Rubrivivax pictus]
MLFFQKAGSALHEQQRPAAPNLIGWFHIRLVEPIVDRASLLVNLQHSVDLLAAAGQVPSRRPSQAG